MTALVDIGIFREAARAGREPAGGVVRASIGTPKVIDEARRAVRFCFSDGSVDRVGDRIMASGWDLAQFRRNAVALFAHDANSPPIGRATDVRVEGDRLMGTIEFMSADLYPFADTVYEMVRQGYLRAVSVGFLPIEYTFSSEDDRPYGIDFKRQELLEISVCPVPANANALVAASIDIDRAAPQATAKGFSMKSTMSPRRAAQARVETLRGEGFPSLSSNLLAIARAKRDGVIDPRLRAATGAGESDPSSGGFAVATQFASELIAPLYEENPVAALCDRMPTGYPLASIKIPGIDETSRADGSRWGGSLAYWIGEGDTIPTTFPRFKSIEFSPKKLVAAVVCSNELYSDSPLFEAAIHRIFRAEMGFKLDQAIVAGTGAGMPQGVLNSAALITVAKEMGQASGTIIAANIEQMFKRLPAPSRRTAVWLVHEDVSQSLDQLNGGVGEGSMFLPAGVYGNEYPLLKGRPVIEIEQANPLGSAGDIILADLGRYIIVDGGQVPALSADVRFLNDELVFRFIWRVDGQSAFSSPITPYHGTNTRSPFVALGAR